MSNASIASLIEEAAREHWCTKRYCTTCGATLWQSGLQRIASTPQRFVSELEQLPLSTWYDLPEFGGAIYHCFSVIRNRELVDQVLTNWLGRLDGHYRIADAVTFYVVREGSPRSGCMTHGSIVQKRWRSRVGIPRSWRVSYTPTARGFENIPTFSVPQKARDVGTRRWIAR